METNAITEPIINREFDILRTMRHERIASLIEAFKYDLNNKQIVLNTFEFSDVLISQRVLSGWNIHPLPFS